MSRRTDLTVVPQAAGRQVDPKVPERVSQLLLPLVAGLLQAKQDMMSFIWSVGHGAVDAVFKAEVDALLGPAGKRKDGRELYRWGTVKAEFPLGGRQVTMPCPRVGVPSRPGDPQVLTPRAHRPKGRGHPPGPAGDATASTRDGDACEREHGFCRSGR